MAAVETDMTLMSCIPRSSCSIRHGSGFANSSNLGLHVGRGRGAGATLSQRLAVHELNVYGKPRLGGRTIWPFLAQRGGGGTTRGFIRPHYSRVSCVSGRFPMLNQDSKVRSVEVIVVCSCNLLDYNSICPSFLQVHP